jgi:hypothetical protein
LGKENGRKRLVPDFLALSKRMLGISPFGATSVPSLFMVAYAVLYLLAILALTARVFKKRDL